MNSNRAAHFGFLHRYSHDLLGGGLLILLGAGAVYAGFGYDIGSLSRMGPGYFPVAVGGLLAFVGTLIMLSAKSQTAAGTPPDSLTTTVGERKPPEWRAWCCIGISILAFVVLGRYGGLLPASFAVVFISALGDRDNTWLSALILAVAMTVICAIVFYWALQLQFPLFTWG